MHIVTSIARAAALVLPLVSFGVAAAPRYHLTDLGPHIPSVAGINAAGKVAMTQALPTDPTTHALTWIAGQTRTMDDGGTGSIANAISDSGVVAGLRGSDDGSGSIACIWSKTGARTDLGTLGGTTSSAMGVNAKGLVVGTSYVSPTSQQLDAFVWRNGVFTDLGTLGGTQSAASAIGPGTDPLIVGSSSLPSQSTHATLWRHGRIHDLGTLGSGGSLSSIATALNADGVVVGWSMTSILGTEHAFRWDTQHGMQDLGTLGGYSEASAINGLGDVVGDSAPHGAPTAHAFIVTGGQMLDLNDLLDDSSAGWTLLTATGINDAGQITGRSQLAGEHGTHAFVLTPVGAAAR